MPAVFLVSDTHFGHLGVCKFMRSDGVTKLRPWDSAEDMDEAMVKAWNSGLFFWLSRNSFSGIMF